jgi:hypothetical protein
VNPALSPADVLRKRAGNAVISKTVISDRKAVLVTDPLITDYFSVCPLFAKIRDRLHLNASLL